MAIAHDFAQESHTGTTGSASEASFTWTHAPVVAPQGVLVFVFTISATKTVTSVTYDGKTMLEIPAAVAIDTAAEPGRVDVFLLGVGVPATNPATVVVNRTNDATVMWAVSVTVTATAGMDVNIHYAGIVLLQENGAYAEQSVTDGSPGTNSLRYCGGYYGGATPAPAGASSTLLHDIDLTSFGCTVVRETTAGQGSRSVGLTQATSDDRAGTHFALKEALPISNITMQSRQAF